MSFHPYLYFGGNCREAFSTYEEIFGGELTLLSNADVPEDPAPNARADLIAHAALSVNGSLLMASDDPTTDSFGPVQGMQVTYRTTDVDDAKRVFEALANGGQVTLALGETFFSPAFGMCIDRFGTPWMIGTDAPAGTT
jgi:PhnB protein